MKKSPRYSILVLLLASYIALGVVGHLEVLQLFGFGSTLQYILQTKPGPPPSAKVYWTQYKHIPATVKISVPSPAIATRPEASPRLQIYEVAPTLSVFNIYPGPVISLHSPRAPPQI